MEDLRNVLLQYKSIGTKESGRGLGLSRPNDQKIATEGPTTSTNFCQLEVNEEQETEEVGQPDDDGEEILEQGNPIPIPMATLHLPDSIGKTVVTSDSDVTNGFVTDGKMLPYVFEANESGVRKRSSKILPICGVCGDNFRNVTTMKRHLVTHTGERPFSCKVCRKEYTQKGNLRVHERTHRNDRPFECNICHQKFYRKEPMQKHQRRQHGVVRIKMQQPLPPNHHNHNNNSSSNIRNGNPRSQSQVASNSDSLQYTSPVEPMKSHQVLEPVVVQPNSCDRSMSEFLVAAAAPKSQLPLNAHLLNVTKQLAVSNKIPLLVSDDVVASFTSSENILHSSNTQLVDYLSKFSISSFDYQNTNTNSLDEKVDSKTSQICLQKSSSDPRIEIEEIKTHTSPKPIKLRMKFAYQKELKEQHQGFDGADFDDKECEGMPENREDKKQGSAYALPLGMELPEAHVYPVDPLQCVGCCTIFAHKSALKSHQICPEDKEQPFKCCKCRYKFHQEHQLQQHQLRVHQQRNIDVNPATLQYIINRGVKNTLKEIPLYHGKTSGKHYPEVSGLEYEGCDDEILSNKDVQPLDLSPVKKCDDDNKSVSSTLIRELENNPMLSQPPLPKSPQHGQLYNYGSATLLSSSAPSTSTLTNSAFPVWKKQRTKLTDVTHWTLPPTSTFQKPPCTILPSQFTDGPLHSKYKHSSWILGNTNTAPINVNTEKKSIKPGIMRDELLQLQGQNGRTV